MESEIVRDDFDLEKLTKRAVRSFWMDGLWEIAVAGMLFLCGYWGNTYVRFLAFPSWTWHFQHQLGRNMIWVGLLALVIVLVIYLIAAWFLVKRLKRKWISPSIGHVEHRFFLPTDPKVFIWYGILYSVGLGLLYGIFTWIKGGAYVFSVPFIISPAAILWGVGQVYDLRRYKISSLLGFSISFLLELLLTAPADPVSGPANILDVLPQWGNPILSCLVWSGVFISSGLVGLITTRRMKNSE